ncbi:esterase CG5412-like [Tripterygium wilfordii]|uniref:esterase CG5412-like n=1 Tax=Tripterygium wilfordii TaxID=458696 RepID=UPI0018F85432|nr:esterase CG5412-like [Tripterygium wilfordii]
MENENHVTRKPRILCLHGFRTSAEILRKQVSVWPEPVLESLDLVFLDAPFAAEGKSNVEGIFDPPYFEWFQSNEDYTEFRNFEGCVAYIEDYMMNHGPFDGLLGFSRGAHISAALPGMQLNGVALTKVAKIKFVIIISGAQFGGSKFGLPDMAATAFSSPIECPSLHFIGEHDFLKSEGIALLESFVNPVVIYHSKGHRIPRLDDKGVELMLGFIERIENISLA